MKNSLLTHYHPKETIGSTQLLGRSCETGPHSDTPFPTLKGVLPKWPDLRICEGPPLPNPLLLRRRGRKSNNVRGLCGAEAFGQHALKRWVIIGSPFGRGAIRLTWLILCLLLVSAATLIAAETNKAAATPKKEDPQPPVIDPGPPGGVPSDAIVLFDGKDLSKWRKANGAEAEWKVENGYAEVNKTGYIFTKEEFGDVQLHVEWASPAEAKGEGQGRGNSGVYLMGRYEIQVLDSYQSKTYPNGQAAAFYGNAAPLVNACRRPGEWQSYDIIFHTPKQKADGGVEPGSFTVLHNGVLVQDHIPVAGGSTTAAPLKGVVTKGPLSLQDHGNPVRYRNIWVRKLNAAAG